MTTSVCGWATHICVSMLKLTGLCVSVLLLRVLLRGLPMRTPPHPPKRESACIDQTKPNKYDDSDKQTKLNYKVRLSRKQEDSTPKPNGTGTTNTKGVSCCSHAGVMLLRPGLYHFQQISGRCFLQLLGQRLRLPIQEHVSFRLVGAIKVCVGGVLLLYYTEVCWKHSTHECFWRSFISGQMFF